MEEVMLEKTLQITNRICLMALIPIVSLIHFSLNVYRGNINSVKTIFDDMIPFTKIFVLPYVYWFAYIFIILLFFAVTDYKQYYRLLMSIIAGMFICIIIFYFFPTTVPRPDLEGNDGLSNMVRYVYGHDNPYDCFPSIHVLNSIIVTLFFYKYYKGKILSSLAVVSCVSITLSTLFIKQHYVLDAVASIILGTLMYWIFTNDYVWNRVQFRRILSFMVPERIKDNYIE
jgi:membrane-associated phospholipid phosphatase